MSTKIEWAEETWNPVTGCTKISEACRNCYAERMAKRLAGRAGYPKDNPFAVTLHPDRLKQPFRWRDPRRIFVCSMGDLFHPDVKERWIDFVFGAMGQNLRHTYLLLTKRPERMAEWINKIAPTLGKVPPLPPWPWPNVWLGVTAENQEQADRRIPVLLSIPAAVRFVSIEPMLGPVSLTKWLYTRFDTGDGRYGTEKLRWAIVGGESGPKARPMHPDWVRSLRDQCKAAGVAFLFKQWGEWAPDCLCQTKRGHPSTERPRPGQIGAMFRCGKHRAGRELDGQTWDQYPEVKA